jgi:hypothetical protein
MTPTIKNLVAARKAEYLVPILATLSLIAACIIVSSKKFFWNDELFSYYFLADSSFGHMMVAFHDKLNNTPALYFILGWLWAKVFSASELSLRLLSSLGFCIAFWIAWLTLRRTYGFWSASVATLSIFCTSKIVLYQNSEARMYGLYMTIAALTLMQFDLNNRAKRCSRWILISNFLIQTALVHTHLHGMFFAGATLGAQIVRDLYSGLFRPRLYSSFVVGWLTLIFYIPAFLVQADAGNPKSWLAEPTIQDLLKLISLFPSIYFNFSILMLLILLAGMQFFYKPGEAINLVELERRDRHASEQKSFLILAFSFLMVSVAVWLISRTVKPIFFDRYLMPTYFALGILIAHFFSKVFSNYLAESLSQKKIKLPGLTIKPLQFGLSAILIMMISIPLFDANLYKGNFLSGEYDGRYGYTDLPIVTQASSKFLERFYNTPKTRDRYFFLLDRQVAESPAAGLFALQEYKHHDAWRRVYPEIFKDNIVESEAFLKKYSRFLVIDYPEYQKTCRWKVSGLGDIATTWTNMFCPQWLEMRIINNPQYKVTVLGPVYDQYTMTRGRIAAEPKEKEVLLLVETRPAEATSSKTTN